MVSVKDKMPEPDVQIFIETVADCGGAAMLGKDGKWYWTFDGKKVQECKFEVTHWGYL